MFKSLIAKKIFRRERHKRLIKYLLLKIKFLLIFLLINRT